MNQTPGVYAIDDVASTGQVKLKAAGFLHTIDTHFTIDADPTTGYKITGPNCAG